MASTKPNFRFSTSRILLFSVVAFISLSGLCTAKATLDEPRQCYWCGPLAEQVHRSQRAAPCTEQVDHVTACESGLTHCAVVATSPPHIESRYCVKLYQDECYPLYCNSTKMWKMICPCRGNLCNGANTDREREAFADLAKLVAKTNNIRIKKRTIVTPLDGTNDDIKSNTSYKVLPMQKNHSDDINKMIDEQFNSSNKAEETNIINANNMQVDNKNLLDNENNKNEDHDIIHADELNVGNTGNFTDKNNDDIQSDQPVELDDYDSLLKLNVTDKTKMLKESTSHPIVYTVTMTPTINRNDKSLNLGHSPTAVALQQNENTAIVPKSTTIEPLTNTQITTDEGNISDVTPKPTGNNRNHAARVYRNIFTLVNWILLYHCF